MDETSQSIPCVKHNDDMTVSHYDMVIVGAGISGINAAYRVQTLLPDFSYTVLEGRHEVGGTWSLFKYPGIRSDSDLHTFGYPFYPWEKSNPIASGESIIEYLKDTANKFGIDEKFQFNHKVSRADWRSAEQRWKLEVDHQGRHKVFYARFLIMGTGYYDYDKPLQADIPGIENFEGTVVHPQFWPEELDYRGKNMVVIGSGATAITILPSVVRNGVGHVTMLQRSPSYILNMDQKPSWSKTWLDYLPRWLGLKLLRYQYILISGFFYWLCRTFPDYTSSLLRSQARMALPKHIAMDPHFKPKYAPWDQRLCLCPDNDFFECFESGRASIVTNTIKTVTADGILLNENIGSAADKKKLAADIIVTATGLNLSFLGKIAMSIDNVPVKGNDSFIWRHCMLSSLPNLGVIVGYANASWTLGSDTSIRLFIRIIQRMQAKGYTNATPMIKDEEKTVSGAPFALTSTYLRTAANKMPKVGATGPWKRRVWYGWDNLYANYGGLNECMVFGTVDS